MKLLLCEDEKPLSNALTAILKRNNYSVDAVYNGEDTLDYILSDEAAYDAVILDIMTPKKDGLTVLKEIREKGKSVPVLILTAKTEIDDKVKGLDLGADDYLTKPFASEELLARIRSITRRSGEIKENTLRFRDLSLDRDRFELSTPKGPLPLTSKEFQIMEAFMLNPSTVFSPEKLMDRIWGFDSETEINVVWTYISYLRKKLKKLESKVNIKLVRNVGYMLEDENA